MNDAYIEEKKHFFQTIIPLFSDEQKAVEYLEDKRWGEHQDCPKCGSVDVYKMTNNHGKRQRDFRWRCRECEGQYTVRIGTIFEESRIPLRHWLHVFFMASEYMDGCSASDIRKATNLSYKASLRLIKRIKCVINQCTD